ncbi:hypothetical protein AGMMS49975_13680 [Clostridia bacterium]|nr:hypothetical protein AGMMS49975_13680 [Clostridia bacterium]
MKIAEKLLLKVKANLVLEHNADDELLLTYIHAAVDYAQSYQKTTYRRRLPPSTEQAIIMLSSHFYESRDGSTGGFFADTAAAGGRVWETVRLLLAVNRNIEV